MQHIPAYAHTCTHTYTHTYTHTHIHTHTHTHTRAHARTHASKRAFSPPAPPGRIPLEIQAKISMALEWGKTPLPNTIYFESKVKDNLTRLIFKVMLNKMKKSIEIVFESVGLSTASAKLTSRGTCVKVCQEKSMWNFFHFSPYFLDYGHIFTSSPTWPKNIPWEAPLHLYPVSVQWIIPLYAEWNLFYCPISFLV